jgi:hypothetical protein
MNDFVRTMCLLGLILCVEVLPSCDRGPQPGEALFPARLEGLLDDGDSVGYINAEGKVRIKAIFNNANEFSDGVAFAEGVSVKPARFGPGWAWGLIREDGSWLVAPGLLAVEEVHEEFFSEGLCAISKNGKCGYLDKTGAFKIEPTYDFAESFSGGLAVVEKDGHEFYINPEGVPQFAGSEFETAYPFAHGLAVVKTKGKEGVINTKGEWMLPAEYDWLEATGQGRFLFAKEKQWGVVDAEGRVTLKLPARRFGSAAEGMALVQIDGKWGALDLNAAAKLTVPAEFDELEEFAEGLAVFVKDGRSGYVDKAGKIVIDLGVLYETCEPFHHGLAYVRKTGSHEGYLKKDGTWAFRRKLKG